MFIDNIFFVKCELSEIRKEEFCRTALARGNGIAW